MKYESVQKMIEIVKEKFPENKIGEVFSNCYGNTIHKTVKQLKDGSTFVITGDIPAMWLRDSVCQLRPYLILCQEDVDIADLMEGLIKRQFDFMWKDPYANAFNEAENNMGHQEDNTNMQPYIWERKYEIDSLCFPIQFSYLFWKNAKRTSHFTKEWKETVIKVLDVLRTEQYHETRSDYRFERQNCPFTDTLSRNGMGAQVKEGIGLVWSGFRPSDDACTYGYLIPSNMFLVVVLRYLAEIARDIYSDEKLAQEVEQLGQEIDAAIQQYAIVPQKMPCYAYEVDGYGKYMIMDDANLPSLLSLPYIKYCSYEDEIYQNTLISILSEENPYYFKGTKLQGIGSAHTPAGFVWDIGVAMEGLVEQNQEKKLEIINRLIENDGGTGLMHESINCNDDTDYTREWFSWANAVFAELVLDYLGYRIRFE